MNIIKKRIVVALALAATRALIWSTRFGKQTAEKRALRALWKASH